MHWRLIIIKRKILPLIIAALMLSSCAHIPMGDESSVSNSLSDTSTLVITTPSDLPTSGDASAVVSEQSGVTGEESETSETVSEPAPVEYEYEIDIAPYLKYICPDDADEYALLVNYDHRLTGEYIPGDLKETDWTRKDRDKIKLRENCVMALDAFLKEAALNGVTDVSVTSGYRSYSYQKWLFAYYVEQHQSKFATREECEEYVMTFSCREGCSEHQTGLALDMHNLPAADEAFADTASYAWLSANAHRFGFILRFPKGKEDITGISYEPWHYRFVGREAATIIYENNLTLEEYVEIYYPSSAD